VRSSPPVTGIQRQRALRRAAERRRRRRRRLGGLVSLLGVAISIAAVLAVESGAGVRRLRASGPERRVVAATLPVGGEPADALPFPPNPRDRYARPDEVPPFYADGLSCSTGCRPAGAEFGWPIKPFHREHGLRAGLNELRPGSLHVAVDIQARSGAAVYALQPGVAEVLSPGTVDVRVRVGSYIYWHIDPSVSDGETVVPFETVLGHILFNYGHMALSELNTEGEYVNPLRPGGIVLRPYANHAPPEIATPAVAADGQVIVAAYSPQSFVETTTYPTPVLAPAALAYRLYTAQGAALTPLEWAFRGTHLLPFDERDLIYAPGAHSPGFNCFAFRHLCVPQWVYRVAGGFAPPLPHDLAPGRYRLTIYAWDWTDQATALDTTVTMTSDGWESIGRFPRSLLAAPSDNTPLAPGAD